MISRCVRLWKRIIQKKSLHVHINGTNDFLLERLIRIMCRNPKQVIVSSKFACTIIHICRTYRFRLVRGGDVTYPFVCKRATSPECTRNDLIFRDAVITMYNRRRAVGRAWKSNVSPLSGKDVNI